LVTVHHVSIITGTRAKILIAMAWGLSAVFSLPMLILCNEQFKGGIVQCQIQMPVQWGWKVCMLVIVKYREIVAKLE
jgi:hypothetical protein